MNNITEIRQAIFCVRVINAALPQVDQDTRHALESVRAEHIGEIMVLLKGCGHVSSASIAEEVLFEIVDGLRTNRPLMSYESPTLD